MLGAWEEWVTQGWVTNAKLCVSPRDLFVCMSFRRRPLRSIDRNRGHPMRLFYFVSRKCLFVPVVHEVVLFSEADES